MGAVECTVADGLARCLKLEGVDVAFGIASGYLSDFLDALRRSEIRAVTNLHEGAAGFAAAGYALASHKLGVVYAQSGPGVTNALTGVAAAHADSIPLVLVAAQAPLATYGRHGHQEATGAVGLDQMDAYRSATCALFRPPTPASVVHSFRRALATSLYERTTTAVEISVDMMATKTTFDELSPAAYRGQRAAVDVAGIETLATLLKRAARPALLIGHRVVHRGVSPDIVALCEEHDVPCATVDHAKGALPEDHPLALGVLGTCGHESAAAYFRTSDLVITLGARLGTLTTFAFDSSLFPHLVQVDDRPEEIGRNFPVELSIVGDLAHSVRMLRSVLAARQQTRGRAEIVHRLREEFGVYAPRPLDRNPSSTAVAVAALRAALPRETVVVGDTGLTLQYLKHFFPIYASDGFYNLYGMAPMGAGFPLAIGVQIARPEAVVLCVVGDGGALVHLGELGIAAQHKLPIIFVVVNNHGYKQVSDRMERYQSASYGCALPDVDFAAVATACGVDGYRAHDHGSVVDAARSALERRRPALIEVAVEGDNLFDITPARLVQHYDKVYGVAPKA